MTTVQLPDTSTEESAGKLSEMRELTSRKVSQGHGVDYELVILWDPEDGKVYAARVLNDVEPQVAVEIEPDSINFHLDHPALIPFE